MQTVPRFRIPLFLYPLGSTLPSSSARNSKELTVLEHDVPQSATTFSAGELETCAARTQTQDEREAFACPQVQNPAFPLPPRIDPA
jgi:hypothetical protein